MFLTSLRWVQAIEPARLALSARPRGGDELPDEILSWRAAGIDKVVSFLEPREAISLHTTHFACFPNLLRLP